MCQRPDSWLGRRPGGGSPGVACVPAAAECGAVGAAEGVDVSHRPIDAGSHAAIKQALARRIPAPADAVKRLRDARSDAG